MKHPDRKYKDKAHSAGKDKKIKTELNKNEMKLVSGGDIIVNVKDLLLKFIPNPLWIEDEKSPVEPDFLIEHFKG